MENKSLGLKPTNIFYDEVRKNMSAYINNGLTIDTPVIKSCIAKSLIMFNKGPFRDSKLESYSNIVLAIITKILEQQEVIKKAG